ncbi:response regulator [bacterium]|nr:response regulator [bacterium]
MVDSILDYFRLPEHKKNAPPGVGARVAPSAPPHPAPHAPVGPTTRAENATTPSAPQPPANPVVQPKELPRTPAAAPAPSQAEDEPIRILLVEDDHKWAKLVNAYVSAINHERTFGTLELVWVETLSAAVSKISKRSYDLIFLDLMLPDSQGITTLESVWAKAVEVQTPVVVMSNLDSGGVMDRVREVTGRDILLKKNISKKVLFGHIDSNVFED